MSSKDSVESQVADEKTVSEEYRRCWQSVGKSHTKMEISDMRTPSSTRKHEVKTGAWLIGSGDLHGLSYAVAKTWVENDDKKEMLLKECCE